MRLRLVGLLSMALLLSVPGLAQDELLEEKVLTDSLKSKDHGPNGGQYSHVIWNLGFLLGEPDDPGASIKPGSYEWGWGSRSKYKVGEFYSLGYDLTLQNRVFALEQDSSKVFPDSLVYDRQRYTTWNVNLVFFHRFNFGRKRGNHMGNFIDLAGYGEWAFSRRLKVWNDLPANNGANAGQAKVVYKDLDYPNPFNYGVMARVGFNKVIFYGRYRFSDQFDGDFNFPELPRWVAGIEVSLY